LLASEQTANASDDRVLHAAVAPYLSRHRGQSHLHTGSDLKIFVTWYTGQCMDPMHLGRIDIERYACRLEEVRCYQPSRVSRRLSVVVGFHRVCVVHQILPYSPAESPTLGLGHLQFEAPITTARLAPDIKDFAPIAMLGHLGLRIFESCGANIDNLGEEHGHRVPKVRGKGDKTVLIPLPPAATRGRPGDRRPRPRSDPAQRPPVCGWTGTRRPQAETTGRQGRDTDRPDAPADAPTHS
jgi:integrase/recombinase XerD